MIMPLNRRKVTAFDQKDGTDEEEQNLKHA